MTRLLDEVRIFEPDILLIALEGQEKGWQELRARGVEIPTIVMAEPADLDSIVRTIKFSAYDFLAKPVNIGSSAGSAKQPRDSAQRYRRKPVAAA